MLFVIAVAVCKCKVYHVLLLKVGVPQVTQIVMACDLGSGKVCTTSLLVAALLEIYIIAQYIKESTCMYKLFPLGAERQKRIHSVEKVQCNYTVHRVLHVVSWAFICA